MPFASADKLHKLITIFLWKEIGTHAHNLTELHEGRSKILQNLTNLHRCNSMKQIPLTKNLNHFAETSRGVIFKPYILFGMHKSIKH